MPLRVVLKRSLDAVSIEPTETYRQITVRLHHRGVVLRGSQPGSQIGSTRQYRARAGQLILSRIDARNGAIGLVPSDLDGAIVTNDFWLFDIDASTIIPAYLDHYVGTPTFTDLCKRASEGTTNRVRLQPEQFLDLPVPLPPLAEQRRIVARIEGLAAKIEEARGLRHTIQADSQAVLRTVFRDLIESAQWQPLGDVAPLVRRPIEIMPFAQYDELGIRSFGKGTFHKPPLTGVELGSKRVYRIEPGDLVFNNVFAWEGAVAVAQRRDEGRIGSHRFITCVPQAGLATAQFLRFHFLTSHGLEQLGGASPGGAGRNRTLGLTALSMLKVPVPEFHDQIVFDRLQEKIAQIGAMHVQVQAEMDALLPAVLDRAFRGEL